MTALAGSKMLHDAHLREARMFARWRRRVQVWWWVGFIAAAFTDHFTKTIWPSIGTWLVGSLLSQWLDMRACLAYDRATEVSISVSLSGLTMMNRAIPGIWE